MHTRKTHLVENNLEAANLLFLHKAFYDIIYETLILWCYRYLKNFQGQNVNA